MIDDLEKSIFARAGDVQFLAAPAVAMRGGNSGGYAFYEVFVTNFARVIDYAIEQGCSLTVARAVLDRHLRRYLVRNTIAFKTRGRLGQLRPEYRDAIRRIRKVYGLAPPFGAPR